MARMLQLGKKYTCSFQLLPYTQPTECRYALCTVTCSGAPALHFCDESGSTHPYVAHTAHICNRPPPEKRGHTASMHPSCTQQPAHIYPATSLQGDRPHSSRQPLPRTKSMQSSRRRQAVLTTHSSRILACACNTPVELNTYPHLMRQHAVQLMHHAARCQT
jgi:hypothetical protein